MLADAPNLSRISNYQILVLAVPAIYDSPVPALTDLFHNLVYFLESLLSQCIPHQPDVILVIAQLPTETCEFWEAHHYPL